MSAMVSSHLKQRLHLLGAPRLDGAGERTEIRPSRPALLLLHLAWQGDWITRDSLAHLFSPHGDGGTSRSHLRLLLNRARKFDWAGNIEVERNRLRFAVDTDLTEARPHLAQFTAPPVFLQGWSAEADLGKWLDDQRNEWAAHWRHEVLAAALVHQEMDHHDTALELLNRLLADDPLAEDALQAFLLSSSQTPARQDALERYEEFERDLRDQLGLEPLAQTKRLVETLKAGTGSLTPARFRADSAVRADTEVPLVGRIDALAASRATPAGSFLLIEGEPGIGKTRLVREVLSGQDALWLQGRQGLQDGPWLPLTSAIRDLGRDRLLQLVTRGPLQEFRAELGSLLPELAQHRAAGASHSNPYRVMEAVSSALRILLKDAPTIVVDDAQWLDVETIRLLHFLHELQEFRLFGTVRSGPVPDAWRAAQRVLLDSRRARSLKLAALGRSEISELLHVATGSAPPEAIAEQLAPATGGNPLMLLQAIADWRDRGWLGTAQTADWQQLPDHALTPQAGLRGLLLARVGSLTEDTRRVLDAAAVLDHDLEGHVLAGMTAFSESAVVRILGNLEDLGLLRSRAFAHGYIREVVLGELPESVRLHLHARAAMLLENQGADELVIADHLHAAGNISRAVEIWLKVGSTRYAVQPGFESEAEGLYRRIHATDIRTPAWYQASAYLGGRLLIRNSRGKARELLEMVLTDSTDPYARTFALVQTAFLHYLDGRLAEAETAAERASRLIVNLEAPELHSDLQLLNCMLLVARQQYAESLSVSGAMVAELRQGPPSFALGSWLARMAADLCMLGRFEEALPVHHDQLEIARLTRHVRQQVAAINDTMATLDDLGRIEEGLELGLEGLELGEFDVTWPLLLHVALARRARGDSAGASADVTRLLDGDPSVTTRAYGLALLAELSAAADDQASVSTAVSGGLELAAATDLLEPRVVAATAAARFGTGDNGSEGLRILAGLKLADVPANLRPSAEAALARLQR